MLTKLFSNDLTTEVATFIETLYTDGKDQAISLSYGAAIDAPKLTLRVHSHCLSSHVFLYTGCDCKEQMFKSQQRLLKDGSGLIIWLDQEGRSNGHLAKMLADTFKKKGLSQSDAYVAAGYSADARDYSLALKIVAEHRPKAIHLLTGNPEKVSAVSTLGIPISVEAI